MNSDQAALELLRTWLARQLSGEAATWFDEAVTRLRSAPGERAINLAISLVTRKLGKDDLALSPADLDQAEAVRTGWQPAGWSVDQAGRVALLLATSGDTDAFCSRFDQLLRTSDVGELVAFYQGLPLYPAQEQHRARAAEGVRTNMRAVFEAVAHRNPYPAEQLSESQWNQMVLKALFIDSTLGPIQGLDARANAELSRMLCDYAQERWSASRPVSPELWRCVGKHASAQSVACLGRALRDGDAKSQVAATLALLDAASSEASGDALTLLEENPGLTAMARDGTLGWDRLEAPS